MRKVLLIVLLSASGAWASNCSLPFCTDDPVQADAAIRCTPCPAGYYCDSSRLPQPCNGKPSATQGNKDGGGSATPAGICPIGTSEACEINSVLDLTGAKNCAGEPALSRWSVVGGGWPKTLPAGIYRVDAFKDGALGSAIVALGSSANASFNSGTGVVSIGAFGTVSASGGIEVPNLTLDDVDYAGSEAAIYNLN